MPPKRRSVKSKVKEEDEQPMQLSPEQQDMEAEAEVAAAVDQLLASPVKDQGSDSAPPQPLTVASLTVARSRLSTLLSKVHREEAELEAARSRSPAQEAAADLFNSDGRESPSTGRSKSGDAGTPSSPSKKKRKREAAELGGPHHTYVMKLFDRSVDLAQFNEKTALYPVCRAWMANKPRQPPKLSNLDSDEEYEYFDLSDEELGKPVRKMPAPAPKTTACSRVPKLPPNKSNEELDINVMDGEEKELLEAHKAHWRQVKQNWVNAAFTNEKRFDKSVKIIEDIYKRAQELYS